MRRRGGEFVAVWLVSGLLVGCMVAEDQSLIGVNIYPKSNDMQIRVTKQIVGTGADLACPVKVRMVKGGWLLIWVGEQNAEGWINRKDVCTASEAITYFTQQIAANPIDVDAYFKRSLAWEELGNFENALADITRMIRLLPDSAAGYNSRGEIWRAKREYDIAINDYDIAIHLDPRFTAAYNNRAIAWQAKGDFEKALADYNEAIRLDPNEVVTYNGRAWLYATCPNEKCRNGTKAVENATKVCELTKWKNPWYFDTLAAAYAEAGDFKAAVDWQSKSLDGASNKERVEFQSRLDLYRSGKPFREELNKQ